MQSAFHLPDISPYEFEAVPEAAVAGQDAYQTIRVACEELFGELPVLTSIDDVLRIKDENQKDIIRLREVLGGVEESLRECHLSGISKAKHDVELAVRDLNANAKYDKVATWATYLSLPVGIVETLLTLLPVCGITCSALGTAATLASKQTVRQNSWIQIVR